MPSCGIVIVTVAEGTGIALSAGFAVAVGEAFNIGNGVGVGVVFSSFLTAKAEFTAKIVAITVRAVRSNFIC